jgi:hypothetical protein
MTSRDDRNQSDIQQESKGGQEGGYTSLEGSEGGNEGGNLGGYGGGDLGGRSSEDPTSLIPINRQDDDSDLLFDSNRLLKVEIDLPEENWDALRFQTRELNFLQPDCLGEPFPSPFTWFEATVSIDGTEFNTVGLRKKGFFLDH